MRLTRAKLGKDPIAQKDPLLTHSAIWYRHIQEADEFSTSSPESMALTPRLDQQKHGQTWTL